MIIACGLSELFYTQKMGGINAIKAGKRGSGKAGKFKDNKCDPKGRLFFNFHAFPLPRFPAVKLTNFTVPI
jgi:hypothetical protein